MADKLFRKPDERSGPAMMDREPIFLPDQRKRMSQKVKRKLDL